MPRLARRPLLPLLAIALALAPRAEAGAIHGTLWLGALPKAGALIAPHVQQGVADAVVYLEQVPAQVEDKLAHPSSGFLFWRHVVKPTTPLIVQRSLGFHPRVTSVPVGGSVEFANQDRVYHNAFSVSAAKHFDLGMHAPGHADTLKFEKAGVINLHDEIFPDMLAYLVVTPNHAVARPDSLGRFTLPKLPPGTYTVHVWHPHRGETRQTVEVPKRGDVAVDLKL